MPSDMVTWECCPGCDGAVALGWIGHEVTEIDCASGCQLSDDVRAAFRRAAAPPTSFLSEPSSLPAYLDANFDRSYPSRSPERGSQAARNVPRQSSIE